MNKQTVMPGWIAARVRKGGFPVALSMLGVAVTLNGGLASDDEISEWYSGLVDDEYAVWTLNEYYVHLEQAYPFLEGHLGCITRWTETPKPSDAAVVSEMARELATVAWSLTEPMCGGEVLGPVYTQMTAIGARRTRVFDYITVEQTILDMVQSGWGLALGSFTDMWCGSGTRAIAAATIMTARGTDPTSKPWRLNDPDPYAVAMTGLNAVGNQLGLDVKLSSSREWAEVWGQMMAGNKMLPIGDLPPELAEASPALAKSLEWVHGS